MIFLTGGTGLVGSYILLLLMQKKTPVLALKRPSSSLKVCEKIFNYYNQKDLFSKLYGVRVILIIYLLWRSICKNALL